MSNQVFFAWTAYQRRAETMQPFFGYSLHHLPPPFTKAWLKPLGYMLQFWKMTRIIRSEKADVVWVQLPPTFLLHLLRFGQALAGRRYRIVADCHNRTFRPPWSKIPGTISLLNSSAAVLVHNDEIKSTAVSMGVSVQKLVVLEDPPAIVKCPTGAKRTEHPTILVPCSFNPDEPIAELMDTARHTPEITFLVTGNVAKARARGFVHGAPKNVVWTGFVPTEEYERMLFTSTAILGLTTIEGIQLSVASEAIGAGKAMVLSDTSILRAMFGRAALFTSHEPASLAAACREAASRCDELDKKSAKLREDRWAQWRQDAHHAKALV